MRSRSRSLAVLIAATALTGLAATGPALAEPDPAGTPTPAPSEGQSSGDALDPNAAVEGTSALASSLVPYSAEELASATAAEVPTDYTDAPAPARTATIEEAEGYSPPSTTTATAQPYGIESLTKFSTSRVWGTHGKLPASTIGKLYYTGTDGKKYYCSASVIAAANHNTIWTAGHCVTDGKGHWYSRFQFKPDYFKGTAPYGSWTGKSWAAPTRYFKNKDSKYDMAAIALYARPGNVRLGDMVGWQGYKFGDGFLDRTWSDVRNFGYPQDTHPARTGITGEDLRYCVSNAVTVGLNQAVNCDMGHGASGGPWIYDMPLSRGWGYIIGLNSYHTSPGVAIEYSPSLGNAAINVHKLVQAK
ncbi:trypsin-like serine peptidase [Bailinhaonella thermotolerans]|uniref:Serine protease n=1 Tax=Bailinhaonella thermotolerans TaxID=1070861 RepID=A0A3A4AAS1_9ACTN|nr:hypothetical protein [Bailinhaonella thermotolerans]RJL22518.1 hypothetical protein D5H75_35460 [Bailinhaonella thermotolerans]